VGEGGREIEAPFFPSGGLGTLDLEQGGGGALRSDWSDCQNDTCQAVAMS
jgi:hypothetical protein